jgi:hypothetical protein
MSATTINLFPKEKPSKRKRQKCLFVLVAAGTDRWGVVGLALKTCRVHHNANLLGWKKQ